MGEKQPDWADRLTETWVRESEWRYTPRGLNCALLLIGLAGVLLTTGSGWGMFFALLAATHVSIRVRSKSIVAPPDAYDVFTWRRPKSFPPERCAKEGCYCWTPRGLIYLGPCAPVPEKDEADSGNA